ncbi:ubiquitin-conjugating enzyme E2 H [Nematocida major]|uniref:ubiquitin-conjugating enzyme E2 H n=1 Tax=Nematocida major TaxID=1912982 RepID=UPI0020078AF0|nr:ubiquitin-conjugating enzyme E2 H [Nematocida major]KAH9385667.1 ubiquitin-conjugating enzyme E2 H [Nematocida major]
MQEIGHFRKCRKGWKMSLHAERSKYVQLAPVHLVFSLLSGHSYSRGFARMLDPGHGLAGVHQQYARRVKMVLIRSRGFTLLFRVGRGKTGSLRLFLRWGSAGRMAFSCATGRVLSGVRLFRDALVNFLQASNWGEAASLVIACLFTKQNRQRMHRVRAEINKLFKKNYAVEQEEHSERASFIVAIDGPAGTPFSGGRYKIRIFLPREFPFKSPSIGFVTKVFHPNIDENSGTVCLDVLNQVWSPLYDVLNIVETFLPQLLAYPNPDDPLNIEAGRMFRENRKEYEKKVAEYVGMYAKPPASDPEAETDLCEEIA